MKIETFAIAAGAMALGLALWTTPGIAQGPMWDRVNVNLPYTVTIGDKTLQPGDYVIQQNRDSGGGSKVLLIYSDSGMKFETSAMTIPAVDINTARDTKVVLHHFGSDYYFDKVWIQGKDYGYEFPMPSSLKDREKERMASVTVPAQYQSIAANATTAQSTEAATNQQQTTPAATTTSTTSAQATQPATTTEQTTPAATTAATTAESAATTRQTTPQAATTSAATSAATAQMTPAPAPTTAASTAATAERSMAPATAERSMAPATAERSMAPATDSNTANREMPNTSAGWLMMLLGGGSLSAVGAALRRKR